MMLPPGLALAATITPRPDHTANQDAVAVVSSPGCRAVIVADGIGSNAHAKEAAWYVAGFMKNRLQSLAQTPLVNFQWLFAEAQNALRQHVQSRTSVAPPENSWGTTLIVAVETLHRYEVAYCGNGFLFHIRQKDVLTFDESHSLPWCYTNLLSPHTRPEAGREALYRYIAPQYPERCVPTVLTIEKENDSLLIIGTDGIYSSDQLERGVDPQGNLWTGGEEVLTYLHTRLKSALCSNASYTAWEQLPTAFLEEIQERQKLHDDASLGLLRALPRL